MLLACMLGVVLGASAGAVTFTGSGDCVDGTFTIPAAVTAVRIIAIGRQGWAGFDVPIGNSFVGRGAGHDPARIMARPSPRRKGRRTWLRVLRACAVRDVAG